MSKYKFSINHATGEVWSHSVRFGTNKLRLKAHNPERGLYVVHIPGNTSYVDRQVGRQYAAAKTVVLEATKQTQHGNDSVDIWVKDYEGIMSW